MNNRGTGTTGAHAMSTSNGKIASTLAARPRPSPYARPTSTEPSSKAGQVPNMKTGLGLSPLGRASAGKASIMTAPKEVVPVNDLVQLARQSFSQKNFTSAIQYLTRALAIAPKDINLLDSRAASLEKLNKLDEALTDAKAMIQNHPLNPKGYLRAGKILRIQQHFKSSTKIFQAGVDRCDKGGKDYETLTRVAAEMAAKMEDIARKRALVLDPMDRLPFELIMAVFSNFNFTERVRCLAISKKWMNYLSSVRHFWLSLDLARHIPPLLQSPHHSMYIPPHQDEETNGKVTNQTVLSLAKYVPPRALRLGCAQQVTGALFAQLNRIRRLAALETMSIRLNTKVTEQDFSLLWNQTPNLRSVDLHGCLGVMDGAVMALLDRCPLLEELDIAECRATELCFMINCGASLPNMRKLTVGRWEVQFAREGIDALVSRFPNLTMLDIRTMRPRGIESLEGIAQLRQLKHLYMESIETTSSVAMDFVLRRWIEGIPDLESFQMNACKGVSDSTIRLIAAGFAEPGLGSDREGWSQSLRMLDLSASPYLTSEGLEFLNSHPLPRLHTLLLNRCGRVTEAGLRHVVRSSGSELCRLHCAGYSSVSDKLMNDIKDHCPKIEVLHLSNSGMMTGIGLMAVVNERGRGLEKIIVDDCPALGVDAVERARVVLGENARVSYRFHRSHR